MSKVALITGVAGQDGSLLARHLLELGYQVHGLMRRSSVPNSHRLARYFSDGRWGDRFVIHYGDLTDSSSLSAIIGKIRPDEVYNLGAQSHVAVSFETPEFTANADAVGVLRLLEAIRQAGLANDTRFYQASTSELYGKVHEIPQRETTPFHPRSPYGVAKLYGYWITVNYREAYAMHASNGILFNHEGAFRGEMFVTRKITKAVARISLGGVEPLSLGNLDAKRDWGDAEDYVRGMHLIVQQEEPDDYVLATGELHSVREFVEAAFSCIGKTIGWEGEGVDELGRCHESGETLVVVDKSFFRPAEVDLLVGDPSKAHQKLGWFHQKDFNTLVSDMVKADINRQSRIADGMISLEDFI
jgi:GDPmannose 4,6-dehydratase